MDIPLTATKGDTTAFGTLVTDDGILVSPLREKLDLSAFIAGGVAERNGAAVAPVRCLLRSPEHVCPLLCRNDLVLLSDTLSLPPDGVELNVVGMWRMANVVGVADCRLVKHHGLSIFLDHRVNYLLGNTAERKEVVVSELWFLVVPRPRQVIAIPPPDVGERLYVGLVQNTELSTVVGPTGTKLCGVGL